MKKNILFVILGILISNAVAQVQTIHSRVPPNNYLYHVWPAYYMNDSTGDKVFRCNFFNVASNPDKKIRCWYMYTPDTLTIYGIAASMMSAKDLWGELSHSYLDTTYNDLYDYLRIYEAGATEPIPLSERLKIHMHVTPISYYWDFDAHTPYDSDPNNPWHPFPMYELYFNTPVTVADSFYVAREERCCRRIEGYAGTTMEIIHFVTYPFPDTVPYYHPTYEYVNYPPFGAPYDTIYWTWLYDSRGFIPLIFPILTPDTSTLAGDTIFVGDTIIVCDTIIIGGDTTITYDTILSVPDNSLVQRLTGIIPNPASASAKVVSSLGMSQIEAFNLSGEKIYSINLREMPISTTIDISHWPQGIYVIRIHTPQGISHKRLSIVK